MVQSEAVLIYEWVRIFIESHRLLEINGTFSLCSELGVRDRKKNFKLLKNRASTNLDIRFTNTHCI